MADLRAFTRELMKDAERDLGTGLEWVAVDHWNTDNPHVHVLVRGRADDGQDFVISRDYISEGFRARAAERVTLELAPRTEGLYRRRVTLASGRFAMIDDGMGFQLVPWRPALEQRLGQQVSAVTTASGVDWDFAPKRRPGL